MDSTRQQKYSRLIQKDLSEILQRDARHLLNGAFITVTTVRVSPDLGLAKVYLSFLMVNDKAAMLDHINSEKKVIRRMLSEKIRNQARIIPELNFYLDDNVDYADNIDKIFSKIDIPKEDKTEDTE
ncbi:MAG TPA: 30S ribosome-binding factor RbfA [Cytophagaceae bacterium]